MALSLQNYLLSKDINPQMDLTIKNVKDFDEIELKKTLKKNWLEPYDTLRDVKPRGESRQAYLSRLYLGYLKQKEERKNETLSFKHKITGEERVIRLSSKARFTKRYRASTYYKLYNFRYAQAVGFLTLTVPAPMEGKDWNDFAFVARFRMFSKYWQRLRSFAWRYGIRFDYFRVFEVTKQGLLHAHILLYSMQHTLTLYEMEVLANYWHKKIGFVKLFRWTIEGDLQYTWEYFINDKSPNVWRWDPSKIYPKDKNAAVNYVMKYQMKELSEMGKAIMTKFRVRTYAYSQSMKMFSRKIISTGEWELVGRKIGAIQQMYSEQKKEYYEIKKNKELQMQKDVLLSDPLMVFRYHGISNHRRRCHSDHTTLIQF